MWGLRDLMLVMVSPYFGKLNKAWTGVVLLPAVCRQQPVGCLREWEEETVGDSYTDTGKTVSTSLCLSQTSLHYNLPEGNTDGWSPPPEFPAGLS